MLIDNGENVKVTRELMRHANSQSFRQDFDRHRATQLGIKREIDFANSACADFRADFVASEFCAGFDGRARLICDFTAQPNPLLPY